MNTVKIIKADADLATEIFNKGKAPWIVVIDGTVASVTVGRAEARKVRQHFADDAAARNEVEAHTVIAKAADVKFEVISEEPQPDDAASIEDEEPKLENGFRTMPGVLPVAIPVAGVLADFIAQGDAVANEQLIAEAVEAPKGKIPHTRESTIERPCKRVWHIADEMAKAVNGHKNLKRKDVLARCVAEGIAFYTARTQYQLWLTIQNGGSI